MVPFRERSMVHALAVGLPLKPRDAGNATTDQNSVEGLLFALEASGKLDEIQVSSSSALSMCCSNESGRRHVVVAC